MANERVIDSTACHDSRGRLNGLELFLCTQGYQRDVFADAREKQ